MTFKYISKFLFVFFSFSLFSAINTDYNDFLKNNESQLLGDLFTLNIGIMKLKNIGNINLIDPLDSQNVTNTIKNVLDKVPSAKLTRKEASLKAVNIYLSKLKDTEKQDALFMKEKLTYMDNFSTSNTLFEFFLMLKKHNDFSPIIKKWFENIENPFFALNISLPFDRILLNEETICETQKVNDKGPIDILIYGEIEKIDKVYFITIFVYSYLLQKKITDISFVSDSENLMEKTRKEFSLIVSSIFEVNYASLNIDTKDKDTEIYLNSNYIGKEKISKDFIVPGNYVLTLKKQDYEDKIENLNFIDNEVKNLSISIENKIELQVVNFYIEPLGTKIFINSLYRGKTPMKLALKKGNYIISFKNDLYESYRYILKIDNIKNEELNLTFHLKSKDNYNFFKIKKTIYYTAFWNFTFSLITTIPLLIFAVDQWERYSYASMARDGYDPDIYKYYNPKDELHTLKLTRDILYGFAAAFTAYTVLSAVWLFYSLADYLLVLEKRDFIPIIEFYKNEDKDDSVNLGFRLKL
jgi:hypothetical protein